MRAYIGVAGLLFMCSAAEAKPSRADGQWTSAPQPVAATEMPSVALGVVEAKTRSDSELYQEAQRLLVQPGLEERIKAASMFAALTRSDDRELAEISKERFDKAIAKVAAQDSGRAVEAVIGAWRTHGQKGDFDAAIDKVYTQLAEQTRKPTATTLVGGDTGAASCAMRGQLLTDLTVIASERHVKDLAGWRTAFAEHATTCAPTVESRIKAYDIYLALNKLPEAANVATQIGNDYLARFTDKAATPWRPIDFNLAVDFWGKAGVTAAQREAELVTVAERAAESLQWEAAAVVYDWLGRKAEARAMRKTLEPHKQ